MREEWESTFCCLSRKRARTPTVTDSAARFKFFPMRGPKVQRPYRNVGRLTGVRVVRNGKIIVCEPDTVGERGWVMPGKTGTARDCPLPWGNGSE